MQSVVTTLWRVALCGGATFALWWLGFNTGIVFMAGVLGLLLASPILDLAGDLWDGMRHLAYRNDEGRYFAFKGRRMRVVDGENDRWIHLSDVRQVFDVSDAAVRRAAALGFVHDLGSPPAPHMAASRLVQLAQAVGDASFGTWLQRTVIFPSVRSRELAQTGSRRRQTP